MRSGRPSITALGRSVPSGPLQVRAVELVGARAARPGGAAGTRARRSRLRRTSVSSACFFASPERGAALVSSESDASGGSSTPLRFFTNSTNATRSPGSESAALSARAGRVRRVKNCASSSASGCSPTTWVRAASRLDWSMAGVAHRHRGHRRDLAVVDALDLVDLVGERVDLLEDALVVDRAFRFGDDRRRSPRSRCRTAGCTSRRSG